MINVKIPGPPVGQARGRAGVVYRKGADGRPEPVTVPSKWPGGTDRVVTKVHDPAKSRDWKGTAQEHILRAVKASGGKALQGPILAVVENVFALPKGRELKASARPTEWNVGAKDIDNLAKAALDAGNGVAWGDDREIALLVTWKRTAAQGELPYVRLRAWELRLSVRGVLDALSVLFSFFLDGQRRVLERRLLFGAGLPVLAGSAEPEVSAYHAPDMGNLFDAGRR